MESKELVKQSVLKAIEICGTQDKLAERAGITQGAVGKYIRKEAMPRGETAKRLSKAVNGALSPYHFAPLIFDEPVKISP